MSHGQETTQPKSYSLMQFSVVVIAFTKALSLAATYFDAKDLIRALKNRDEELQNALVLFLEEFITKKKPGAYYKPSGGLPALFGGGGPEQGRWKFVSDVETEESSEAVVDQFSILEILEDEDPIPFDAWLEKVQQKGGMYGAKTADAIYEQRFQIPKEWENVWIHFPGTVWKDERGATWMRALFYRGGIWCRTYVVAENPQMVRADVVLIKRM